MQKKFKQFKTKIMNAEFLIFKENVTKDGKVKIVSNSDIVFDRVKKIEKYLYLGYKVYELNGKEIK